MLSENDKTKIRDYLSNVSDINPDTWITVENKAEALNYAKWIAIQEKLKMFAKVCATVSTERQSTMDGEYD